MFDTRTAGVQDRTAEKRSGVDPIPSGSHASARVHGPRVALLTPYTGGNFGDAAIQDALIGNLSLRLPGLKISGISLNSDNFLKRHGEGAFPLCALKLSFYEMYNPWETGQPDRKESQLTSAESSRWKSAVKSVLRKIPGARRLGKKLQPYLVSLGQELRHIVESFRFLRSQELLIVSGGGQFDEEWGGPWGHPYCLFKWAVIAKAAGIPFAIASVGAGKTSSPLSRFFLSWALRLARYRSYRDINSRKLAAKWFPRTMKDPVIPDLAFSLPRSIMPVPADIRSLAQGRPIVAVSPIAFARPGNWPLHDQALYDRYRHQIANILFQLSQRGYFLVVVWSSAGDDERVISEILSCLDDVSRRKVCEQSYFPTIESWRELVAIFEDVDFLIASRLHSAILGSMTKTPTIAISYDPKVDWLMQDLDLTQYLLQIGDFVAEDAIQALDRLAAERVKVVDQIVSYQQRISSQLSVQYDVLAKLVSTSPVERR